MTSNAITRFIVTPENNEVYKNTFDIGDKKFVGNTHLSANDKDFLQLQGVVTHEPLYKNISVEKGYRLHVQHNTFRPWTDIDGELKHGNVISDGEYFVTPDLIYAYNDGSEWYSTNGWVYLLPINETEMSVENTRDDKGIIAFKQDPLYSNELDVDYTVTFRKGKRVNTTVDGKAYLRVRQSDILLYEKPRRN